jgi:hypothetical protein
MKYTLLKKLPGYAITLSLALMSFSFQANAETIPNAPSNLSGWRPARSVMVVLNWKDNSNNETGFEIQKKVGTNGTFIFNGTVAANVITRTVPCSTIDAVYFRIRAFNSVGSSTFSNTMRCPTS